MKSALIASLVSGAVAGGTLSITWADCGDASTHGKATDVEPSTIDLGTETQMLGSGTTDKTVSGGTYDIEAKAGGIIDQHFTGNNCEAKTFNLPLGLGSISWDGLSCPVAAGDLSVGFKVELSSAIPASLAKATIAMKAVDQDSEDLLCVNVQTQAGESEEQGDCDGATCGPVCECAYDKCGSAVSACLADSTCAAAQGCVMACACGDMACAAACTASGGDAATVVLQCLAGSCSGDAVEPQGDCDGATCGPVCECAYDKCGSAVSACLADSACASAQGCVMACACGDMACAAACTASGGDAATVVLQCLAGSCSGDSLFV